MEVGGAGGVGGRVVLFVHSDIQKATLTVFMVDLTFQSLAAAKSRVSAAIQQKKYINQ